MFCIFISYSRNDLGIAEKIIDALAKDDLEPWIDWKNIPKGETFEGEIQQGIQKAEIFLFLVSPDSVQSDWCNREIAHAINNGKRILPIVIRDADLKNIHPEISKRNWIFCRNTQDDFNKAIEEIRKTIHTDYEWLKYHTELQIKALRWEQKKDNSRLLRGKELREAEKQLTEIRSQEGSQPTKLQHEYILASRTNEERQRRQTIIGLSLGLIVVVLLAIFAWRQRNTAVTESNARATAQIEAEQQAKIALAREYAALAQSKTIRNLDLSILLRVEALHEDNSYLIRNNIFDFLTSTHLLTYLCHDCSVNSLAISPDSKVIALSGCAETNDQGGCIKGGVNLWSLVNFQKIDHLSFGDGSIQSIAFSPDGKILASAEGCGKIILIEDCTTSDIWLWSTSENQLIGQLSNVHSGSVTNIDFSPDGKTLASGSADNSVVLWNVVDRHPIWVSEGDYPVYSLAFSPDGKTIAVGGCGGYGDSFTCQKGIIQLLEVSSGQNPLPALTMHEGYVSSLAFSPDGKVLASGSSDKTVILWNVADQLVINRLFADGQFGIMSLVFSPDGKTLASGGGGDNTINIWALDNSQSPGKSFNGHSDTVHGLAFSPDGTTLASASSDSTVILWRVGDGKPIEHVITAVNETITDVVFSPDSKTMALAGCEKWSTPVAANCLEGKTILWDPVNNHMIGQPLIGPKENVRLAFSSDGKILASGGCAELDKYGKCLKGEVILWDVATHKPIGQPLIGHESRVTSLAFIPHNSILATGSSDGKVILWQVATQKPTDSSFVEYNDVVRSIAISPDGKILAAGGNSMNVILWDIASHQLIGQPLSGHDAPVSQIIFSPDGKTLASSSWDHTIIFWDIETLQPIKKPLKSYGSEVESIAFSPDGNTLASGSWNGNIILWDVASHQPVGQELDGLGKNWQMSLAFNPNGKMLVSAQNNVVILWDTDTQSWVNSLCEMVGRNFTQAEWQQYFLDESYRATCPQWPAGQ